MSRRKGATPGSGTVRVDSHGGGDESDRVDHRDDDEDGDCAGHAPPEHAKNDHDQDGGDERLGQLDGGIRANRLTTDHGRRR